MPFYGFIYVHPFDICSKPIELDTTVPTLPHVTDAQNETRRCQVICSPSHPMMTNSRAVVEAPIWLRGQVMKNRSQILFDDRILLLLEI